MPALEPHIMPQSDAYRRNHAALTELVDRLRTLEDRTRDKSKASRACFEQRGQLLPRDRLGRLLDAGVPLLELSMPTGFCLDHADPTRSIPSGGFIAGIGWMSGVRAMIIVNDASIDAGAVQSMSIEKFQRAQTIALEQKLPFIHLVESAGANLLTYRVETFIYGGSGSCWLARLSAAGTPVIGVVHGSSTAGGAYMPGLPDCVVTVRDRARAFLAGPLLLKVATGEIATEEELGDAEIHATTLGLAEYLAEDDADVLHIARELVATLDWNRDMPAPDRLYAPLRFDAEELLGIALTDHRRPLDMREVIAHFADESDLLEFKPDCGPGTITGHAVICGMRVGVITNNGPLDPAGATKVVHFTQVCYQSDTPLLYLQNTTGFIVGKTSEQTGMIKHGSETVQAMANATVPCITMHCGASSDAGSYGMSGRGFLPDFRLNWPSAKTAMMGAEQATGTMATVIAASMQRRTQTVDHDAIRVIRARVIDTFERQSDAFAVSGRLLNDGVIDPRNTHKVLACVLGVCDEARRRTLRPIQFGVARPQPPRSIHKQPKTTGARHHALHP